MEQESTEDVVLRKYLYFLLKLVEFVCDLVPSYQHIFPDQRTRYWDSLSQGTLDSFLERIVQHTPCRILSHAYKQGLLTSHKRILLVVGQALCHSKKNNARCLSSFIQCYERKC